MLPDLKLLVTICYLSTTMRNSDQELAYKCGDNTFSLFVIKVWEAIYDEFQPDVLPFPKKVEWQDSVDGLKKHWQTPNCIGALDGKHVRICFPVNQHSYYFNDKKFHSLLLMVLVDYDYKFCSVEVGMNGSSIDAQNRL